MGASYKSVLNKNRIKNKSGKYTIFIRITLDRRSAYISTGEKIEEKFWQGKENKWIRDSHPFAFELNSLLSQKIHSLKEYEYRQKLFGNSLSLQNLKDHITKKSNPNVFSEYLSEFIRSGLLGKSLNTIKKYRTVKQYITDFNPGLTFNQLNENTIQEFAGWLSGRGLAGSTVHKYFDVFKVICRDAIKRGYLEKDPFLYIDIGVKREKPKRTYLEINEISRLKNFKIPTERRDLEIIRTWWLFCFYCGFYYSDLKKLKWDNIKSSDLGYCIVSERHKNNNGYLVPIHRFAHAVEILEMQKNGDPEYVFPNLLSEQKFNKKLKELGTIVGLEKKIMNKTARHSNIQFWEAQGLETQHVAKMVGHTKESTTKNYYDLSLRDINSRVAKFDFSSLDI